MRVRKAILAEFAYVDRFGFTDDFIWGHTLVEHLDVDKSRLIFSL